MQRISSYNLAVNEVEKRVLTVLGPVDVRQRRFTGDIAREERRIAFYDSLILRTLHKLRRSYYTRALS